jgi:hypothetical protein
MVAIADAHMCEGAFQANAKSEKATSEIRKGGKIFAARRTR